MAEERVVLKVELSPSAAVEAQIRAAGGDPSKIRPAGGGLLPPRAGTVTPPTVEQAKKKDESGRKNVERDFNLLQRIREASSVDRELDFDLRQRTTELLRDRRRDERVAAKQAAVESRAQAGGAPTGAGGVRRRRGRPGRGPLGAAVASGAATAAAGFARPFGASAAAAAASGAAIAAATFPVPAAIALIGLTAASIALAPAMAVLGAAVFATTKAFNEMEDLIDARVFQARALREARGIFGRIRRGERIGGEVAGFITASSQLDQAIRDAGAEILRELLPVVSSMLEMLTALTEGVTPQIEPFFEFLKPRVDAIREMLVAHLPFARGIRDFAEDLRDDAREAAAKKEAEDLRKILSAFEFFDPANFKPEDIPGIGGI